MPTLIRFRGDGDFHPFLHDTFDVCGPPLNKRTRVWAPFGVKEERIVEEEGGKTPPSLDNLPDECLFEIFLRVQALRDRSSCACVSKRWLMIQSSIRRSEILSEPPNVVSSTISFPGMVQQHVGYLDAADSDSKDYNIPTEEMHTTTAAADTYEDDEQTVESDGHLTRSLEGKKATDVRLASIAIGTAKLGGLGKLLVRGNNNTRPVTDTGLTAIARGCPLLKALSIWKVASISDTSLIEIANGCPQLEKLDLCQCPTITDKGLLAIAEKCSNLKSLTIESCPQIGNSGLQAIGKLCTNLQVLSIKDCPLVGDQGLAGLIASASKLMKIKLEGVYVSDVSLAVIGHYAKELVELSLSNLQNVGERGVWALGNARGLKNLKKLVINSCKGLTDVALQAIGFGCEVLKHLCLRRCCFLSDNGLRGFTQANTALENLELEECNRITQIGIFTALSFCKGNLKALTLVKCMGIKDNEMGLALMPLPSCDSLCSLTIQGCPGFGSGGVAFVGRVCRQLRYVDFSGQANITDSGMLCLVENAASGIVKMNLSGCVNLTDVVVTRLSELHGGSLQTLHLDGCHKVTDNGLISIMMNCRALKDLDMSKCSVTDHGVAFFSYAKEQQTLQILSLAGCAQVTDRSLDVLRELNGSLVGLNLQNCNSISSREVGLLEEQMWRCDILF